jgi:hypothetical protein
VGRKIIFYFPEPKNEASGVSPNIAIKESFFFLVERSGTELKKKFGWRSLQDFGTL